MKTYSCHKCKTKKPASEFYKDASRTNGCSSSCKSCARERFKIIKSSKEYQSRKNKKQYERRKANPTDVHRKWTARKREARSAKRAGRCQWADIQKLVALYEICATWNQIWPEESLHVDHIIPIEHPLVCGLHVESNLRLMTAKDNSRKSNHWFPEIPDEMLGFKQVYTQLPQTHTT